MPGDHERNQANIRMCIRTTIENHSTGQKLTDAAVVQAVDHAMTVVDANKNLCWAQLADIGVAHVTSGILKKA